MSDTRHDGGPAFPVDPSRSIPESRGMTLRDWVVFQMGRQETLQKIGVCLSVSRPEPGMSSDLL